MNLAADSDPSAKIRGMRDAILALKRLVPCHLLRRLTHMNSACTYLRHTPHAVTSLTLCDLDLTIGGSARTLMLLAIAVRTLMPAVLAGTVRTMTMWSVMRRVATRTT